MTDPKTTDWRSTLRTPEATRSLSIQHQQLHTDNPPTPCELNEALGWMAHVGVPALNLALAECEAKGGSLYDL